MSQSIITKTFFLNEEIILSSPEGSYPILFKSKKALYLHIDRSKSLFDCFKNSIEEWVNRIEMNRDMYSLHIIESNERIHGGVSIKYNDKVLVTFILEQSVIRKQDETKTLRATITIKFNRQADKILDINQNPTYHINDRTFNSTQILNGNLMSLIETLDYILPTRSEAIVNAIMHIFQIRPEYITFDSYQKRYVINSSYMIGNWIKPSHPKRFYKYVSLRNCLNLIQ